MQKQNRLLTLITIMVMSGCGFLTLSYFTMLGYLTTFDHTVIQFVQSFETPVLTMIFKGFTHFGSGYSVTLLTLASCFILFFFLKERPKAIFFAIGVVATIIANAGIKVLYERPRPEIHHLMDASGHSFPSGHTMMAVSLYTFIVYSFWPYFSTSFQRFLFVSIAGGIVGMIALSRVYVGVHYPTDLIGGLLASTTLLASGFIIFTSISPNGASSLQKG